MSCYRSPLSVSCHRPHLFQHCGLARPIHILVFGIPNWRYVRSAGQGSLGKLPGGRRFAVERQVAANATKSDTLPIAAVPREERAKRALSGRPQGFQS